MHGGIMCDLADAAMGMAFGSTVTEEGAGFTTLNLQINFLKAHIQGKITATANVISRGRSIGYVECEIINEAGELIAIAQCTQKVIKLLK